MKSKSVLLAFVVLAVILLGQTEAARGQRNRKDTRRMLLKNIRSYLMNSQEDPDDFCEAINEALDNGADGDLGAVINEEQTGQTAAALTAVIRVQSRGQDSFITGNALDRTVSVNGAGSNVWSRITTTDNADPVQRVFALVLPNSQLALAVRIIAATASVELFLKEFSPTDVQQLWRFVPISTGNQVGYLQHRGGAGAIGGIVPNNLNLVIRNGVLATSINADLSAVFTDPLFVPVGFAWQFSDGTLPTPVVQPPVVQPPVVQPPVVQPPVVQPPVVQPVNRGVSSRELQRAVRFIRKNGARNCVDEFSSRVCKLAKKLAGKKNPRRNRNN